MCNYLEYGGIIIECGHCHKNTGKLHMHIWWENQHGVRLRLFCHDCNYVTDLKRLYRRNKTVVIKCDDWTGKQGFENRTVR